MSALKSTLRRHVAPSGPEVRERTLAFLRPLLLSTAVVFTPVPGLSEACSPEIPLGDPDASYAFSNPMVYLPAEGTFCAANPLPKMLRRVGGGGSARPAPAPRYK